MIVNLHYIGLHADLQDQYNKIRAKLWPPIIENPRQLVENWDKLEAYFPEHQLFLISERHELIGFMTTVPLHYDVDIEKLPETGWDWLISKAVEDYENGLKPNTMGGLQIAVALEFRGQGYSKKILEAGKALNIEKGFERLILPIRPTLKFKHPHTKMADYLTWKKDNKAYDPWIRVHSESGAKIIKVCHRAMTIREPLVFWREKYPEEITVSGNYVFEGALSPVFINLEEDYGLYEEANIWVCYE